MSDAFTEMIHNDGRTILKVSQELRNFLADAPAGDPLVLSLLHDCDVLDRIGNWLSVCNPISFPNGVLTVSTFNKK